MTAGLVSDDEAEECFEKLIFTLAALKRNPCSPLLNENEKITRDACRELKVPWETFVTIPITPALDRKGAISEDQTLSMRFVGSMEEYVTGAGLSFSVGSSSSSGPRLSVSSKDASLGW